MRTSSLREACLCVAAAVCVLSSSAALRADQTQWTTTNQTNNTGSTPAISGHVDGRLHIATINVGGKVSVASTDRPGNWTNWQTLDVNFDAATDTPPLLMRDGNILRLFVRGADDNLYRMQKNGAGAWPATWTPMITDGSVGGRMHATVTSVPGESAVYHFLYQRTGGGVEYRQLNASLQTLLRANSWCDAIDGAMAGDGQRVICIATTSANRLDVESLHHPWNQPFQLFDGRIATGALGAIYDISNMVYFDSAFHLLWTFQYLCDDVSNTYCPLMAHSRFVPGLPDSYFRIVRSYVPVNGNHPLATLAVYRNKLITLYRDESAAVRLARFDNAEPVGTWVGDEILDASQTAIARPGLASFNARPYLASGDFALDRFGNDCFGVIGANTFDWVFVINASRAALLLDANEQLAFYDYALSGGCPSQTDPDAPTPIADPNTDGRPFFTEVGLNIWMLPDFFSSHAFKDAGMLGCVNGNTTGRFDRPCNQTRYPVIIKPSGGIYICSGVWVNQGDEYLRIWEEFGHTLAGFIGFSDNNNDPPNANDAALCGIPLADLLNGFAIFGERVNGGLTCTAGADANGRCRGFTNICCPMNYDVGSRQHSMMYVVYYYLKDGDYLRRIVQEDLDVGDDLLQRKYNWIRDVIFDGVEFAADMEPINTWNDRCLSAQYISEGSVTGRTNHATVDGSSTFTASNNTPDVWYRLEPERSGTIHLDTCGSDYDTILSVHSGCPGIASNEIMANDDCLNPGSPCNGSLQSCLSFNAVAGSEYLVRISGWTGDTGTYVLNVTGVNDPLPQNDHPALALDVSTGTTLGSLVGSTRQGYGPCGESNETGDVWFRFTAPDNGTLLATTCGTHDMGGVDAGVDTVLSLHQPGRECGAGGVLDCNDDWPSSASSPCDASDLGILRDSSVADAMNAGQQIMIRVSSFADSGSGPFQLNIDFVPASPCPGDANGDGQVNITDLNIILGNFQQFGAPGIPGDLNNDGIVNITDLNLVLGNFQQICN